MAGVTGLGLVLVDGDDDAGVQQRGSPRQGRIDGNGGRGAAGDGV